MENRAAQFTSQLVFGLTHKENISVKCITHHTTILSSKTGVFMGIPIFFIFHQKYIVGTHFF